MKNGSQDQRMRENEALFRKRNEHVQSTLKKDFDSDKYEETKVHFYCECPDPNCEVRVVLSPAEYEDLHEKRKQFVVAPGHEQPEIEKTVDKNGGYYVVEKFERPPETPPQLRPVD